MHRAAWFTLVGLVGGVGCGFQSSSASAPDPDGGSGAGSDAAPDAPAVGTACYGASGAWRVCLAAPPTGSVALPANLDTNASELCLKEAPPGWSAQGQPDACFILGDSVTIATTSVTGTRPLVVIAHRTIVVGLLLDYASHVASTSPPRSSTLCRAFGRAPESSSNGGSGGGAGASFMTRAGNGGQGRDNQGQPQNGQAATAELTPPAALRVGCAGQVGAAKFAGDAGRPGGGGGAIYLAAGSSITINGVINASGGGGAAGNAHSGGSGGGAGGVIVLFSPQITVASNGVIMANGGGGAGGGLNNARGVDGSDPPTFAPLSPTLGGNNGGDGYPATGNALDANSGGGGGDGGGGGGGAAGYIRSNLALGTATVSPGADVVP